MNAQPRLVDPALGRAATGARTCRSLARRARADGVLGGVADLVLG